MDYQKLLQEVFDRHGVSVEGQAEIRHIVAIVRKDAERTGYSEGWDNGQSLCDSGR